jgi:hypothetical protein
LLILFRAVAFHVFGIHEWENDTSFHAYKRCDHPPDPYSTAQFLVPSTQAEWALRAITDDPQLHERIRRCRFFLQTSWLESFHAIRRKHFQKDRHFDDPSFIARTKVAVIDWNTNIDRGYRRQVDGTPMVRFVVPPSAGEWRAKTITAKKSYAWSRALVSRVWERAQERWRSGERPDGRPAVIVRRLVASHGEPQREFLFESLLRRLGDQA